MGRGGANAIVGGAPPRGLGDVSSHLRDFVITTFDVDPSTLSAQLPHDIEPQTVRLRDGRERALVSSVSFLNTRFYVGFAPFVKLTCHQTNYRAYVRRRGERAAYFFATSLATPFVVIPRVVWRMPWARSRVTHQASWAGETLQALTWQGASELGAEELRLRGTGAPLGVLDGFDDEASTHEVLTHPLVGYLRRRDQVEVSYSVWHAPLEMERAEVETARYELWERLGLVGPEQAPHSVLVQRLAHYFIYLPPRRYA